jgi:hypothetical protein
VTAVRLQKLEEKKEEKRKVSWTLSPKGLRIASER